MKQISALLIVWCCLAAWNVTGQTAQITFKETTHDFGSFAEDMEKVTCEFEFTNTGNAPLVIMSASASCGCTRPEYPTEPIAPNGTGKISVTYNAKGRPGAFQKSVYIYANTTPEKSTLIIKGNVIPTKSTNTEFPLNMGDLRLKATHIPFFDVYTGNDKTEKIEVLNSGKTPLTLTFDRVPKHLNVLCVPATLAPGTIGEIIVTYLPEAAKDWGMRKDEFLVVTEKGKTNAANRITLSADIREDYSKLTAAQRANAPKLSISPESLDFGIIKGNTIIEKKIKLTNTGKSNLQIRKLNNESNVIEASLGKMSIKPGKSIELTVKVNPSRSRSKTLNHRLFIISNDPDSPTYSVRILGSFE